MEKCLICGEELNLFSKDPITGVLCFNCYQKQSEEWRNTIIANKDNPEKIRELIEEIITEQDEEQNNEKINLSNTQQSIENSEENLEENSEEDEKIENTPPIIEEKFYFSPDMSEEEIYNLINERVRILDKMRFYTQIKDIKETPEFIMLDIIRHQLEVIINQNQLIIKKLLNGEK